MFFLFFGKNRAGTGLGSRNHLQTSNNAVNLTILLVFRETRNIAVYDNITKKKDDNKCRTITVKSIYIHRYINNIILYTFCLCVWYL